MDNYEKIKKYLSRINYKKQPRLDKETLDGLQTAHFESVPYENLDILAGKPLSLDTGDLFEKIVENRRGGYCFELNGLYGWLLENIGFKVSDFTARFLYKEPAIPMRRHRVLVAETDVGRILCDVGIGLETPRKSLYLKMNETQNDGFNDYKITKDDSLGWVVNVREKGEWAPYYSFTEEPQLPLDYVMPSFYCEKHPDSVFNKEPMVAILTPDGRRSLDGTEFKKFVYGKDVVRTIPETEGEYKKLMSEYFGL